MTLKDTPQSPEKSLVDKSDLVSQISHGPTLDEVASSLLRDSLQTLYPDLAIDPDLAIIATPRWQVTNNHVEAGPTQFEPLTHALIRQGLYGTKANYIEGEHFLTVEPDADNPIHLAVSVEEIAGVLNDSAPLLFVEFQGRQLDFWNSKVNTVARWESLSNSLRKALNVQQVKGLNADECAMAREVSIEADSALRKNVNSELSAIQACLIDIDTAENEGSSHLLIGGALVLKATARQRDLLVMFTIERGFESFSSMAQLGASLPSRLAEPLAGLTLKWRLYEPQGNVFDHMAWALIASQLDDIASLPLPEGSTSDEFEPKTGIDSKDYAQFKQLEAAIPDWLRKAQPNDVRDYGRYISALGKLYLQPDTTAAKAEIATFHEYSRQKMQAAIIADTRAIGAASLPLDELRIRITNSFTVNNLTLPNPLDHRTETLAEFAMENEASYMATVFFIHGEPVPAWLTPDFLLTLSAQVDVGKAYLAELKQKLIDDPVESRRQENLYSDQLRLLLPLMALEGKVKREAGIDERGYQYICALFDPGSNTRDAVAIYPLTLTPKHRLIGTSDTVTNMFIISPRDALGGPCLLYRPMLDQPLLQFPSRQNLLYALHQPGELRDSVLAWLPDKTLSFEYAQYVFPVGLPSPWLLAEQVVNPLQRVDRFGQVEFEQEEITGNIRTTLFKSNARAVVDLADRQSQSNAERRWSLLKDSGWALFSVTSNFLSGAVGAAVWVWQVINEIQQALDAHDNDDRFIEWTSLGDVLLMVGIIISHHAVMRRKVESRKPRTLESPMTPEKTPALPDVITLNPVPLAAELQASHCSSLEIGSIPRRTSTALGTYLDTFKVSAIDLTDEALTTLSEAPPHLYQLDYKTYAKVAERWFNVVVDGDDQVTIVHPDDYNKTGPLLANDAKGQWVLDLRLRLRGGGPKSRLKVLKAAKEQRKHQLETALQAFKSEEAALQSDLLKAQNEMLDAKAGAYDALSLLYSGKLEGQIEAYQETLERLHEWRNLGGTIGYTFDLLRLSTELQKYLSFWFTLKKHQYVQATAVLIEPPKSDEASLRSYVESIQQATDLSHEMVDKLTLSQSTLKGIRAAGRPGFVEALAISKLMPSFTALQLKANEMGMSQELCMVEQASPLMTAARTDIGKVIISAATAAHHVADLVKVTENATDATAQVELLGGLVETFSDADQRLKELPDTYPGLLKQNQLEHLRMLIDEFSQLAFTRLQALLPENELLPAQSPAERVRPGPSRQPIKVSKSRPRDPGTREATKSDEAPLTPLMPKLSEPPAPQLKDMQIIEAGLELNLDTTQFIERTRKDALRPKRIPADMQDLFDQQALKIEQNAASVDLAMARMKNPPPVANLSAELRQAARTLRAEGVRVRAGLYKRRKPTQSGFKWLHENQQLSINRNEQGRIRTQQLGDWFQEYRVLDKTSNNQELWVAHFHYETSRSPADKPSTAHLKVSDAYLKTLTPELQQALSTLEPIDGVFRKLDDPGLRKLFLDLEPKT